MWIIPNAKQTSFSKNDLPESVEALHRLERFCYSQRQKEENRKDVHGRASAARLFIFCTTGNRKLPFLDQWNWPVDCPVNSGELNRYF